MWRLRKKTECWCCWHCYHHLLSILLWLCCMEKRLCYDFVDEVIKTLLWNEFKKILTSEEQCFEALLIRSKQYDRGQNTSRGKLRSKSRSNSNHVKYWNYEKTCHIKKDCTKRRFVAQSIVLKVVKRKKCIEINIEIEFNHHWIR